MRGLAAALLLTAVAAAIPAQARMHAGPNMLTAGHRLQGAIGVLDGGGGFATPAAAYSMRLLKSGYAGPATKLRRATGGTQDIGFLGFVPGLGAPLDVAAANTFCASTTCFIDTWYDQSGNGRHMPQAVTAAQPEYVANCLGTLPCVRVTAGGQGLATGVPMAWAAKGTTSVVATRTSGLGACHFADRGNNSLQGYTAGQWNYTDQAVMGYFWPASEGAWHAGVGTFDGAASAGRVDTTEVAGANVPGNTNVVAGQVLIGVAGTSCSAAEVIIWDNYAVTQSERVALTQNQRSFWGLP